MLSFPLFLYFSYHDVMDLHKLSRNRMQIISFLSGKSIQCTVDKSLIISMCLSFVFKQTAMVTVYSNWWRIRFRFTVSSQSYSGDPWKKTTSNHRRSLSNYQSYWFRLTSDIMMTKNFHWMLQRRGNVMLQVWINFSIQLPMHLFENHSVVYVWHKKQDHHHSLYSKMFEAIV